MEAIDSGFLIAALSVLGTLLALPWIVKRKLDSAISAYFDDYYTKLEVVQMFVTKSEMAEKHREVKDELARQHRLLVAIAMKIGVRLHDIDG